MGLQGQAPPGAGTTRTELGLLGQIAYTQAISAYNLSAVRRLYSGDNAHKGAFACSDSNQQKNTEGQKILSRISANDYLVLFDEKGVELTSRKFAGFIEQKSVTMQGNLIFVIGGTCCISLHKGGNISIADRSHTHEFYLHRLFWWRLSAKNP